MAFRKISAYGYIADSASDLTSLPKAILGAECYVVDEGVEYKCKSDGTWVRPSSSSSTEGSVDLTGYATEEFVNSAINGLQIPSTDGLASEEYVNETIATNAPTYEYIDSKIAEIEIPSVEGLATEEFVNQAIIDATHVEDIYGDAHAFGLMVQAEENRTLIEAMLEKGKGMYNFHVEKGSPGLPEAVTEKNSSCRGICCVDTYRSDTNWYGWIVMFDQDGDVYMQYIRNAEPKGWKTVAWA